MVTEIVMPRLGWTMEEGSIVEWIKKDGDVIKQGDIIFTVEGDKAVTEVESFESGILRIPPDSPAIGAVVPIGKRLAYIVQPGEAVPFETSLMAAEPSAATQTVAPTFGETSTPRTNGKGFPAISPRARRVAAELGVDWLSLKGSGRTGRIVERDVRAAASQPATRSASPAPVSPLARRAAEDLGVDLEGLAASMPGKRIAKADVERAAASAAVPASPTPTTVNRQEKRIPLSNVRRITATRMLDSAHTTAPVTLTTEVDATELVKLRNQLKGDAEATARPVPAYTDLLTKLVGEALIEFPAVNSRLDGEQIVISEAINIGIAVDTDRGLLVPVIRDVQAKVCARS